MKREEKQRGGRAGDKYPTLTARLLTEGDETGRIGIDLLEELGHVDVGHAQGGTQQGCELLSGDAFVLVRVEKLHGRGKMRGCTNEI